MKKIYADISNYNCQSSWILKILLKSALPVVCQISYSQNIYLEVGTVNL